jgi:ligand-binding sensor domain-containing protein/signal transduction histidine kinase
MMLLALVLTSSLALLSQQKSEFQEFTHRAWHIQDGLPDQVIQALAQTPDHYLWLGTSKGLLRFDGHSFVEYDGPGETTLRAHGVFCLLVARDGSLWIGTEGGGLLHYAKTGMRSYSADEGLTYPIVRTLYEDRDGAIWAGADFGVFKLSGGRFVRVDDPEKLVNFGAHSIIGDHAGSVWVGGSRLVRYTGQSYREYTVPKQAGSLRIKSLCETRDGTLWIGTVGGLYRLSPQSVFSKVKEVAGSIHFLTKDFEGRLWIGTVGNGLYIEQGGAFQHLLAPTVLPSNTVLNITEDRDSNVWVGTQAGLLRLSRTGMQMAQLPGASDSDFGTVFRDTDGTLWICSTHLFRMTQGAIHPYSFPQLGGATIRTMLRDRSGALWLGTMGRGAYRIEPNGSLTHYSSQIGNNYLRVFLQARDGSVWIGTDGGVSRWKNGRIDSYHQVPGALRIPVTALDEDATGALWIGTPQGLRLFRGNRFVQEAPMGALKDQAVWALQNDASGCLWIGTDSGLYRWKNGQLRHLFLDNLSSTPAVYQILNGASGVMWISGPTSVLKVMRKDLEQAAEGDGQFLHGVQVFPVSGEIQAAELYGGMQPAGVLGSDGTAWFPTSQGILHLVSRRDAPQPEPPPLVLNQVLVDGRQVDVSHGLDLQPGSKTLQISYAPILLGSQSRLRFRRILRGFDKSWTAPTSERSSFYTNLAPGHYVYEVQAFYADDPGRASSVALNLTQRAHFYRTSWFALFSVALLGMLAWLIYRNRIKQIQSRFRAVMAERNRVARELHDTVIQSCTGVSILLEAFSSMPGEQTASQRQLVDYARKQVKITIDEARNAVWNLRHSDRDSRAFSDSLRAMVEQSVHDCDLKLKFNVSGDERSIDSAIAQESLMVVREAVRNAALHGRPQSIGVELRYSASGISLDVSDDGCGFLAGEEQIEAGKHYGLVGMRERVERVGGTFSLQSAKGQGTHLAFFFPTQTANKKACAIHDVSIGES